jgi:putative oxidoreductase
MRLIERIQDNVNRISRRVAWLPPLLARVAIGYVFMKNGWAKLQNLSDITDFFASLHVPAPGLNAALASSVECFGGALLILGLLTRVASLGLTSVMLVAILTAHILHPEAIQGTAISSFTELVTLPDHEFLYILSFLWLAVFGAGAVSLDHLLKRALLRSEPAVPSRNEALGTSAKQNS